MSVATTMKSKEYANASFVGKPSLINLPSRFSSRLLPTLVLTLLITGCAGKISQLPEDAGVKAPVSWQAKQDSQAQPTETVDAKNISGTENWLDSLEDQALDNYVGKALKNNPDLLASAAQLKSAIEQVRITGSTLWPNLSANLNSNRTENETNGVTTTIRTVSGTLNIAWEADIWGKLSQRKKASALSAQAQAELYNAAELSLVANVSRAWYNLVSNKLQLELAQRRLESFESTAKLIEENYERGLRSALDVYLSRTDVQRQRSNLADSKFAYIQSLRTFRTLLGEYPDAGMEFEAKLPTLTSGLNPGMPADLLTRRPDLKASQLQYDAAIASAKAAHRDRFPSLSLTGSIGDSRERFNQLFDNDNMVMNLVGGLTQPLFQAGALKSRQQQAYYQAEAAYANLLKTTLNAFQEVENGLSREALLFDQHTAIKEAVKLAEGGLNLALDRYQSGIESYTTVLQSQRSLFDSLQNEINIRNALLQNRIGLHLALGGDFLDAASRQNQPLELPSAIRQSIP